MSEISIEGFKPESLLYIDLEAPFDGYNFMVYRYKVFYNTIRR